MPAARVATPLWVRAIVFALLVGAPAWGLYAYHDRSVNQRRLGVIASHIAGRPVTVHCPGVLRRLFPWDTVEGSVRFDATGRPSDQARLQTFACGELDAIAEGRRRAVLACVAAGGSCGQAGADAAMAVDVLTHESFHLAGIVDEAETECRSLQTMAWTAQQLGATAQQGRALAALERVTGYQRLPERYRSPDCALGA
jgi:hypothetical protein